MNIMIACEYSGRVREAFRAKGHNAISFDLLPAEDGSPFHIQGDVLAAMYRQSRYGHPKIMEWDMLIAFPSCTDLASSGARWFEEKRKDGRQKESIDFFMMMVDAPVKKWCVENPIGIMSSIYRKPDQIIQPWMFGHGETKATCLWLGGLEPLKPTNIVEGREARIHRMSPGPDRWKERSRTYQGIAQAMADQWG